MIDGVRRRAEFLAGVPLVVAQHLVQRFGDGAHDVRSALQRERRNARFIGELTVTSLRRSRTGSGRAAAAPVQTPPPSVQPVAAAPVSGHAHLGVAELLSAIPAMSAEERATLLQEERAGRNRSRVVELLESLGA